MNENKMEHDRRTVGHDARTIQNFPTDLGISGEEIAADSEEPPDERLNHTPRPYATKPPVLDTHGFEKTRLPPSRKQSLLTQALHSPESDRHTEEEYSNSHMARGMSSASLWSNTSAGSVAELTSDGGFTSPGTRNSSPSPPLPPASFRGLPPLFSKPGFGQPVTIRTEDEHIGPFQKVPELGPNEGVVEAGLGRKRCITFACGRKATPTPSTPVMSPPKVAEQPPASQVKRPSIRFVCPDKISTQKPSRELRPSAYRQPSPAPRLLKLLDGTKGSPRSHRGSDSTVRNSSPRATRKSAIALRARRDSDNSDIGRSEATRFHEFASSEEEIDEWVQESTCHRSRLTVSDTLKIENKLRKLGEEAEEEAIEEEAELDEDEEEDEDEDDGEEEDEDDDDIVMDDVNGDGLLDHGRQYDEESDDGFKTDDEDGFACSDDDSDAGSDYAWWVPQRSEGSASLSQPDHIRAGPRRSFSDSSVGSYGSGPDLPHGRLPPSKLKRRKPLHLTIRPRSPELPDSTDFVCGTLDEDRPLEDAYIVALEAKRSAKHRFTPQDIDPTFPTSDPELDEEDEEDEILMHTQESDQHMMMVGSLEGTDGEARGRYRPGGKPAPEGLTKRIKSPPPSARRVAVHRSPPARPLFDSPPKRLRSPPPARRLRSPPPTRRASFAKSPQPTSTVQFIRLGERPQATVASSMPRTPVSAVPPYLSEEDEETSKEQRPSRGAIEIKAGLEKKRQRHQEKLYQKHCRKEAQREKDRRFRPGIGCKKMREIGLEAISRRRQEAPFTSTKEAMILSV